MLYFTAMDLKNEDVVTCPGWTRADETVITLCAESPQSLAQLRAWAEFLAKLSSYKPSRSPWPTDKGSWWTTDKGGKRTYRLVASRAGEGTLAVYDLGDRRLVVYAFARP